MAGLEVGLKGYAETMVDESNVASSVGSGLLDVFSTPSMIALSLQGIRGALSG